MRRHSTPGIQLQSLDLSWFVGSAHACSELSIVGRVCAPMWRHHRRGSARPAPAALHPCCRAAPCQASSRPLRWQERPLPGPRCQRPHLSPWGNAHDRPGLHRDWCPGCRRPFTALTHTLVAPRTRALSSWRRATCVWCLAGSSRRRARACGVPSRTRARGRWWRRQAARSEAMARQVGGTVDADARDHTGGPTGPAPHGGHQPRGRRARRRRQQRAPGRGPAAQDRPAVSPWGRRQGAVVVQAGRDCTGTTGQNAAALTVAAGRRLETDAARRSRALQGSGPASVQHTRQASARGAGHAHRPAGLLS